MGELYVLIGVIFEGVYFFGSSSNFHHALIGVILMVGGSIVRRLDKK